MIAQKGFGEADYRQGANERLIESSALLRERYFAGSVYLAGRAVESMLRSLIWKHDVAMRRGQKTLDTGHDLQKLLAFVKDLGLLRPGEQDRELARNVQAVGRLWFNNMRFAPNRFLERRWRERGEVHSKRTLKQAATGFYLSSLAIIKRCEALWQR